MLHKRENTFNNTTPPKKAIKEGVINLTGKKLDENRIRVTPNICPNIPQITTVETSK